jgi:hypothetical protein
MLPVPKAAPGHLDLLAQRLIVERVAIRDVRGLARREVLEHAGADDTKAAVKPGEVINDPQAGWTMDELVRIGQQPPYVVGADTGRYRLDDAVHLGESAALVVVLGMVHAGDLRSGGRRPLYGVVRALIVDDEHPLAALCEGVVNSRLNDIAFAPGCHDAVKVYRDQRVGFLGIFHRAGPSSPDVQLEAPEPDGGPNPFREGHLDLRRSFHLRHDRQCPL